MGYAKLPDDAYHIVFGCDENYVKYASVAMMSIIYSIETAFSETAFSEPESSTTLNAKNRGGAE